MDKEIASSPIIEKNLVNSSTVVKDALRLLLILTGTIFIAETRGFLHISFLYGLPDHLEMLEHTVTTTLLVFPFLYFLAYRPMRTEVTRRVKAEAALKRLNEALEKKVASRTAELTKTNLTLEKEVEERRKVQASLDAERKQLYALLDRLPAFVYLKAPDYTIRFANQRFREQFGNPENQFCYQLIQNRETPCEFCPNESIWEANQPVKWEGLFANNRSYQLYDYPFEDEDGTQLVLQLGIDITDRKQAELALEQRNQELVEMSQEERRQRQLAESMVEAAHGLNSSLNITEVLHLLLRKLILLVPYDCACIYLVEPGQRLKLATSHQPEGECCPICTVDIRAKAEQNPYLYQVVTREETLLIQDTNQTPDWYSQSCIEGIRSYLAIPLISEGEVIGVCELEKTEAGFFTPQHQELAEALVSQAAVAIKNARLFGKVSASQERLQNLSRRLVDVQENERRHISKELHDEAGQALTSIKVALGLLEKESEHPDFVRQRAAQIRGMTDHVMEELHRLAMHLRPSSLDYLGLVPALANHVDYLDKNNPLSIQFESIRVDHRLPPQIEITVYRIVQEALTNVIRHAFATQADVLLERRNGTMVAVVEDNGVGFDPEKVNTSNHLGLFGMRERAEMVGGRLHLESQPGCGTTIVLEVPCDD